MNDCDRVQQIMEDSAQCRAYLRNLSPVLSNIEAQIYLLCEKQLAAAPVPVHESKIDENLIRENERLHQRIRLCQQLLAQIDTFLIFLTDEIAGS